jgi:predicted acylesterase/phospholipase RssA
LVEALLGSAALYLKKTGDRAGLVLVVSRHFSKDPQKYGVDLEGWNQLTTEPAIVTREELGDDEQAVRSGSLKILRDTLLEQCNVIVAIGGRWWDTASGKAGVPQEIELAAGSQLPLFLLGGLGGATQGYLKENPDILRRCRNGLTEEQNLELAGLDDAEALAKRVVSQIARLPVRERNPDAGRPFRILCLDGGGLRGVYTAAILAYWEKAESRRIVDHFDLIAGTSTGGLLAIGLGLGLTPAQMLDFYQKEGGNIFPTENAMDRLWYAFRHWFTSKFDQGVLRGKLEQIYGSAPQGRQSLEHSLCRLVITSYNTKADQLVVFRTPHGPFKGTHANQDPVLAALATSAAPTYFDPLATTGAVAPIDAVDGGVWANNPASVALAEAIGPLGISVGRIDMLSIGTTFSPAIVGQPFLLNGDMVGKVVGLGGGWKASLVGKLFWPDVRVRGKVGWVANIAEFLMKTQAQTASRVCADLLGPCFLRIDDATIGVTLDDVKSMEQLIGLGEAAAERHRREVAIRFVNGVPVDRWRVDPGPDSSSPARRPTTPPPNGSA